MSSFPRKSDAETWVASLSRMSIVMSKSALLEGLRRRGGGKMIRVTTTVERLDVGLGEVLSTASESLPLPILSSP